MSVIEQAEQDIQEELEHLEEYLLWWKKIQESGGDQ